MIVPNPRILIVDDDTAIGQVIKAGLEVHGFVVRYEPFSIDAIKTCLEFQPDLVMLDVDMPVKDGGQVAAELKAHPTLSRTPVFFLTALTSKAKVSVTGQILLSKPISIASLVTIIRMTLQPHAPRCAPHGVNTP